MASPPETIDMSDGTQDLATASDAAPARGDGPEPVEASEATVGVVRRWWLAGLTAVLGVLAGAGYAAVMPSSYLARAYVLVVSQEPGEDAAAVNFAQAYGRIGARSEVIAAIARNPAIGQPATGATPGARATTAVPSAAELRSQVTATTSPDAPIIEITGSADNPPRAADLANVVADSLITYANGRTAETRMRMVLLSPAYPPADAASPRPELAVAVGAAAGLLVGAFAVMAGLGRWPPGPRRAGRRPAGTSHIEVGRQGDGRSPADQRPHAAKDDSGRTVRR
jgi:capsular polysaccharide biosynthesis protein